MLGHNLEDLIKKTKTTKSFDEDFFDFTDRLYPWTTVYRFFFFADFANKAQMMLGVGQKNISNYRINGIKTDFKNNGPDYKVGVSYWFENGRVSHQTKNEILKLKNGMTTETFRFEKHENEYRFDLEEFNTHIRLNDKTSKNDYLRFNIGVSPFYRYNKHLSFKGELGGVEVEKGAAFIQKVNLNMPFIPWRWGRIFFEGGAQFDFYEPRIFKPMFKSINFELEGEKLEFKLDQGIRLKDNHWTITGRAATGEHLEARINSYNQVPQLFETRRTSFTYNEMPSTLESFAIKKDGHILHSAESLGASIANCEDAYYSRMLSLF